MKISKLFHWLYASIMFLPLLVIPLFAIYSHRHTLTQQTSVDITYKYETNEVNSLDDLEYDKLYHFDTLTLEYDYEILFYLNIVNLDDCSIDYNATDLNDSDIISYIENHDSFVFEYSQMTIFFTFSNEGSFVQIYYDFDTVTFTDLDFYIPSWSSNSLNAFKYICTAEGIMPTSSDFNVIESVEVHDENSNIMFVMVDEFNDTINKYFNMRRVFNLNDLYNWLNATLFNSTAPIGFNIIFNIFSYWLFVSIFWLMFDVLMYVPNLAHRWLDKGSLE